MAVTQNGVIETEGSISTAKPPGSLGYDCIYHLLSNQRRRLAMQMVAEKDGAADVGDLATQVACIEEGITPDELDGKARKRAYISLYQCHLPKMEDAGVVEYDADRGLVAPGPYLEEALTSHQYASVEGALEAIKLAITRLLR